MNKKMQIKIQSGDITELKVDAIVNAANSSLLGGGGVDGAIHLKAGSKLLDDCMAIRAKQGGCKTGKAVITGAGNLEAHYVIHTVGPVWNNGEGNVRELLASCYNSVLDLCVANNIKTVAFPNISTGIFKFPKQEACEIALKTVKNYGDNDKIETIIFLCYDIENFSLYGAMLNEN
jgi:O-acetyl-ADP-ribose deacetylase (regulator of RNase III)